MTSGRWLGPASGTKADLGSQSTGRNTSSRDGVLARFWFQTETRTREPNLSYEKARLTVATVDLNLWGLARILVIGDDPKTLEPRRDVAGGRAL